MIDSSEKFSNNHAHDTQPCCLGNATLELTEHGPEPRTVGKLERLASQLIEDFAQRSVVESVVASTPAVLQAADQMKMAELDNPALGCSEFYDPGNLVGNRGLDAFVNGGRNSCESVRPPLHVLSAFAQHGIEKDRSILVAGFDRHYIQDPIFASKTKVQSVQDQNQGSSWQAQNPRSRYEVSQASTKTPSQSLMSKSIAWRESFQRAAIQQYCFQNSRTRSSRLAAAPFLADSPRSLALTALTTSRTEVINFGLTTRRFRVARMHARELDTDYGSKYPKTQVNSV